MSTKKFQDICFQVTGVCLDGFTPSQYRIDGKLPNLNDYNFTYIRGSGFVFCLKNVSKMFVVTEQCEFIAQNNFCFPGVSVLTFLSRTEVNLQKSQQSTGKINVQFSHTLVINFVFVHIAVDIPVYRSTTLQQSTSILTNTTIIESHPTDISNHAKIAVWIVGR